MRFAFFKYIVFPVLLLIGVAGCKRQKVPLDEKQFTDLLVDLHLADGTLQVKGFSPDRGKKDYAYYNSVFAKYGIDQQVFDSCMYYYSAQTLLFSKMYDKVIDRLSKKLTEQDRILNELRARDSVNYFPVVDTILLDTSPVVREYEIDSIVPGLYKFSLMIQFDTLDPGVNNRITSFFLSEDGRDTLRIRNVRVYADLSAHTYHWSQYADSLYDRLIIRFVDTDKPEKLKYRRGRAWGATLLRPYTPAHTEERLKNALSRQRTFLPKGAGRPLPREEREVLR